MSIPEDCKCGGHIFIDQMCSVCLTKQKDLHEKKIEELEEQISEFDSSLDEILYYLYEEPYEERDESA